MSPKTKYFIIFCCVAYALYMASYYTKKNSPEAKLTALQEIHIDPDDNAKAPQQNLTEQEILTWAENAVNETMTFDHFQHKEQLQQSSRHFTKKGWESFAFALRNSRIIEMVESNQQNVETITGDYIKTTMEREEEKWVLEIPIITTYSQGEKKRTMKMVVILVIVESDDPINKKGIGIQQWVALPIN